ncbi:MAG TPA: hypothetical protein VLX61_10990 [Anaerolineales bacterium]|nr:hypothetical protein [Anaerolineales bacterium]
MQINLILAWLWIVLGFLSGSLIGLNFKFLEPDWLGGYGSPQRRLYRLGHISFFGLGLINLMFYLTARSLSGPLGISLVIASWALVIGAVLMPICCFTIPHAPRLRNLFYLPVISLLIGGVLTLYGLLRP